MFSCTMFCSTVLCTMFCNLPFEPCNNHRADPFVLVSKVGCTDHCFRLCSNFLPSSAGISVDALYLFLATMPSHQQRIPIHSVPWNDDERPSFNDLSSRLKKTISRYSRYWSPRPNPLATNSALPVPASSLKFVLLCSLWYTSSALSSNTGKAILTQFRYPVTLTFVQFGFVAGYCMLFMSPVVRFTRLRQPTKAIIRSTLPMGMFQVGGHIFSSLAISRIPVSTVHTIKVNARRFTHWIRI
jgi:hypothetical protein